MKKLRRLRTTNRRARRAERHTVLAVKAAAKGVDKEEGTAC